MDLRSLPEREQGWALFLDVDGTLLEIAETPDGVRVPAQLIRTLTEVAQRESGALALISGRSLAQLDRLFAPARFAAAGLHGLERRDAAGSLIRPRHLDQELNDARQALRAFVSPHPGLLLEDKGLTLALHYRRAPELEGEARRIVTALATRLGQGFHVQEGKCVLELKPAGFSKRTAIEAFMRERPFKGRLPVFAGDDVTDEDGFLAVNSMGGHSIRVGNDAPTAARYRVPNVEALRAWLSGQ